MPEEYDRTKYKDGYVKLSNVRWVTNLDHGFKPEKISLKQSYNPDKYPTYDTYPAINVNKTKDIPKDYDGLMGVPITFLDKYNPDQFEIKGVIKHGQDSVYDFARPIVGGKEKYTRLVIKKRSK